MPGIKGIERIEVTDPVSNHAERKIIEEAAAPFLKETRVFENQRYIAPSETKALQDFLSIGAGFQSTHTDKSSQSSAGISATSSTSPKFELPPPVTDFRSLMKNVAYYFRAALGGGGFGAPLMIFSSLLSGPSLRVETVEEYQRELEHFNDLLRDYDATLRATQQAIPLDAKQHSLLTDTTIQEIARRRTEFVRENYLYHHLESASHPEHPLWMKLEEGALFPLGKHHAFRDPAHLIQFCEYFLEKAYRGLWPKGRIEALADQTGETHAPFSVDFISGDFHYGTSQPGSRVVLRFKIEIETGSVEDFFAIGGPRREPVGSFDLLDIVPASQFPFARSPAAANVWLDPRFHQESSLPLKPKHEFPDSIPRPVQDSPANPGFWQRLLRRKPISADLAASTLRLPLRPDQDTTQPKAIAKYERRAVGIFVMAQGSRGETLRVYRAESEPFEMQSRLSSVYGLASAQPGTTNNYSQVGDLKLLTHPESGEQRVKLTFIAQRDGKGKTMLPTGQLTLRVEDAMELGIVVSGPGGKLFLDPQVNRFFIAKQ